MDALEPHHDEEVMALSVSPSRRPRVVVGLLFTAAILYGGARSAVLAFGHWWAADVGGPALRDWHREWGNVFASLAVLALVLAYLALRLAFRRRAEPPQPPTPGFHEYPKYLYHPKLAPEGRIFTVASETTGLSERGWVDTTAKFPKRWIRPGAIREWWTANEWWLKALGLIVGLIVALLKIFGKI